MKKKRGAAPKRHGETYADVLTRQRMLKQAVKEAGKLNIEGKDYVVQDGDIMNFRFNV